MSDVSFPIQRSRADLFLRVPDANRISVAVGLAGAIVFHLAIWLSFPRIEPGRIQFEDARVSGEILIELDAPLADESFDDGRGAYIAAGETAEPVIQTREEETQFFSDSDQTGEQALQEERLVTGESVSDNGSEGAGGVEGAAVATAGGSSNASDAIAGGSSGSSADAGNSIRGSAFAAAWSNLLVEETNERSPADLIRRIPEPSKPIVTEEENAITPEPYAVEAVESDAQVDEGALDALPAPMPRPTIEEVPVGATAALPATEARPGALSSGPRTAVRKGIWGAYSKRMTDAIRARFDKQIRLLPLIDRDGEVRVHFTLSKQGYVYDFEVEVIRGTDRFVNQCQASIESNQPFGEWPEEVANAYGEAHRVTYEFYYNEIEALSRSSMVPSARLGE